MAQDTEQSYRPRSWIILVGVIILLVFLYFYKPFEAFLIESIPGIRFDNVIFWFASLVGVIAYAAAHWQSFHRNIVRGGADLDDGRLVFDTLQTAILVAVIFTAGAIIQAVEMLAEHLISRESVIDAAFGEKLLAIILLVIFALLLYLLHHVIRSVRDGWSTKRPPQSVAAGRTRPTDR